MATKKETVARFKQRLATDREWSIKGMLVIYSRQTYQERNSQGEILIRNGRGFSRAHAEIMSSFCNQINQGKTLTDKQMEIVFRIMPHYAGQLYDIAREKGKV